MKPVTNQSTNQPRVNAIRGFLQNKTMPIVVAGTVIVGALFGGYVLANQQTTAVPGGIWLSIDQIKALPVTGVAWDNVKSTADKPLGRANIADQTSNHDVSTLATALVYARTGNEAYRTKAADAVMSAIGSEKGGRTLALSWNLSSYVISADLINLPQYDQAKNTQFRNWLSAVRSVSLEGRTLISTHEDRPNNWGTSAGASRVAADVYLGDKADLAKAAQVFKGFVGDRSAHSGFSYGDLSWQCDPANPVGINPDNCKKNGINVSGAIGDDMRRGDVLKYPPSATDYPWTALQGATMQAELLSRQGYDSYGWSNQAVKRSVQYLYDLSKVAGSGWWADADEAWVPWVINSKYGSNFPTTNNPEAGRVANFADWTHAKPGTQLPSNDTTAPTTPTSLGASVATEKNVQLTWGPSTDNVTVTSYQVSRNEITLGNTVNTTFLDTTAAANQTYSYKVRAFDAAGNSSPAITSQIAVKSAEGDTTAPVTAIVSPANGTTITAATAPLSFTATDNVKVTKVELYIDTQLETSITDIKDRTTFSVNWNTKASGNGLHRLQVRAYDAAGNRTVSAEVTVRVSIPGGTTTPNPTQPTGEKVNFVTSADSRVSEDNTSKNYGTENFLRVRNDSKDWRSYLKFNVSGLTGTPKSVKLRIFANNGGPDAGTLYSVSNSWTETGITWRNAPVMSLAIAKSVTGSVNDQSWVEFDITSRVRSNGTYSFGLVSNDDNSVYFSSREGKNKPVLVIVK